MDYSIAGLFGGAQPTAGYPNSDYPQMQFTGPTSLQPNGGTAEIAHNVTPQDKKQMLIVIGAVVAGVLILWHVNFNRG